MRNIASEMYERKEYGWFALYIFVIIASFRFVGIIGGVAAICVITGLYVTFKNSTYSLSKKIALSSLYLIGGIVSVLLAFTLLKTLIIKYTNISIVTEPAVNEILDMNSSKSALTASTSTVTSVKRNDKDFYVNDKNGFRIYPPKGWTINESGEFVIVEFDDPAPNQLGAITIGSDINLGNYSQREYAAGIVQGMTEEGAKNVQIIKQSEISLNGNPAYSIEFVYDHAIAGESYRMHALSVSLIKNGTGYAILGVTQNQTWGMYEKILLDTISSFEITK